MRETIWKLRSTIVTACFILIALLLAVMPPEATLGQKVRLVYFHASTAENSIIFFVFAAISAAVYLASRKDSFIMKAVSFFKVAFYLWIVQTIFGAINMKVIWGNFFWNEPKARMGLILLAIAFVAYVIVEALHDGRIIKSITFIVTGAAAIGALLLTSNVFHPKNAIFGSDILAYKIIFVLLVLSFFVISYLWSSSIYRRLKHT